MYNILPILRRSDQSGRAQFPGPPLHFALYLLGAPLASRISHVLWRLNRWDILKCNVDDAHNAYNGTGHDLEDKIPQEDGANENID